MSCSVPFPCGGAGNLSTAGWLRALRVGWPGTLDSGDSARTSGRSQGTESRPDDEENAMSEHDDGTRKVADLIKDIRIAMLTHVDSNGALVSHPMATQEVEFDGDVLFVAERDSHKARDI